MTEGWRRWEGEVVNAVFPLLRFLNGSDHSAVFLTESKTLRQAAIKIIPADRAAADTQLSYWRTAGTLSHPHLIRLMEADRCQLDSRAYLFVVMEYADQTLAQILPHRALTTVEVREMLLPTLDVLALLHRKYRVQGRLSPTNFLVVNDQLKLASDNIRPSGEPAASIVKPSVYDAPEAQKGRIAPAGDIWGLGVTLFEALTQSAPLWADERRETPSLPETLPAPFADIIKRCLSYDAADRPTATELEAELKGIAPAARAVAAQPAAREVPARVAVPAVVPAVFPAVVPAATATPAAVPAAARAIPSQKLPAPRWLVLAAAALLVVVLALWVGLRRSPSPPGPEQAAASAAPAAASGAASAAAAPPASPPPTTVASVPAAASQAVETPLPTPSPVAASRPPPVRRASAAQASTGAAGSVIHEEIPEASRGALATIHGHVRVAVRVSVGPSGQVVDETLDDPGPSQYFARVATAAARKWTFSPADDGGTRQWLLHFEFAPDGATAHATARH
jgi:eukaryotic-like serine/threonine-protein kinase